MTLLPVCVYYR